MTTSAAATWTTEHPKLNRAQLVLAPLEERRERLPRRDVSTTLRRRALALAAGGDLVAALATVEQAVEHPTGHELPFELARALLLKGQLHRRAKQKRAARQALTDALEIFERLGAPAWAERVHAELSRVSPRPAGRDDLTSTEARVAELAGTGMTNREVAEAAFISPKTVEANLSRVYRKLGIRSRAELGAWTADRARGRGGRARTDTDVGKHPIPKDARRRTVAAMDLRPAGTPVAGTYLVECYWPGITHAAVSEAIDHAHAAAAKISATGRHVRLVHSTFVAGDEAVLNLFEGVSADAVREASEQAGLSVDRISPADDVAPGRSK